MKKLISVLVLMVLVISMSVGHTALAKDIDNYTSRTVSVSNSFYKTKKNEVYKKIVRNINELNKLKKHIKNYYKKPNKYIKKLNRYKKSYFKNNALVFVSDKRNVNAISYKLKGVSVKKNKLTLNVKQTSQLKDGGYITANVIYGSNSYFVNLKKSSIKNVSKIKIKYKTK